MMPLVWACGELDQPPTISQTPSALVSPPSSISLDGTDPEEVIVFNVSAADFGTEMGVTYTIQMDRPGNNFASPVDLGASTNTTVEVKASDLNSRAISKGILPGGTGPMEFRVRSTPDRTLSALVGETTSISITTIADAEVLRNLFLVGEATARGWNNNDNNPALFRDPDNADLYVYTGFFTAGGFKVLEVLGQWQPQFGTNDGSTISVNEGGGSDPDVFSVPSNGYYTFTFDLSSNTFTLEPLSEVAATFTTVGIIGSGTANGWDASTAMTALQSDGHIWNITATLTDGEMKFRANDAWDINWGANTETSGVGTQDGPNIPVAAGTYNIWFNSLDGRYILIQN